MLGGMPTHHIDHVVSQCIHNLHQADDAYRSFLRSLAQRGYENVPFSRLKDDDKANVLRLRRDLNDAQDRLNGVADAFENDAHHRMIDSPVATTPPYRPNDPDIVHKRISDHPMIIAFRNRTYHERLQAIVTFLRFIRCDENSRRYANSPLLASVAASILPVGEQAALILGIVHVNDSVARELLQSHAFIESGAGRDADVC